MPFAPFIFLICLVAGIAYLIYVKRKERELIEQVTPGKSSVSCPLKPSDSAPLC